MSWASEGGKGKKKMWVFVAAVAIKEEMFLYWNVGYLEIARESVGRALLDGRAWQYVIPCNKW